MDIKPVDRTIRNLLESGYYQIPRFQRPYSWEKTHVEDFWDDAVTSEDPDYFIGSFVIFPSVKDATMFLVVDGQQRLTTITLLLAALRNALHDSGFGDQAKAVQNKIEKEDDDNERQYILQSETSYPFLQEHIQKFGQAELPGSAGSEETALKAAYELLTAKVNSTVAAIDTDASLSKSKKSAAKLKKLSAIRDKVLGLQLITIQLGNEDDAYLIFETLNTRGKNLGISDLVKNHITRLVKPKNKNVDVAREKWTTILTTLDESAADLDANRFIYHSWLSRYPYVGNAKVFREMKQRIRKSSEASAFLDDLTRDSKHYRIVMEPNSNKWPNEQREIANSLRALNMFRVVQPVPFTLALIRSYSEGKLNIKQTKKCLSALEKFHAQFTGVTSQRTGGGTARMYAASAEDLSAAKDKNERAKVLSEFISKLRERVPIYEEFEANLSELIYLSENTRDKPLVQYLLKQIHNELESGGSTTDYDAMTIEHIFPENPSGEETLSDAMCGALGNLILVSEPLNKELDNKAFTEKIKILKAASVPLGPILESATDWGEAEIKARTIALAKALFDRLLKV